MLRVLYTHILKRQGAFLCKDILYGNAPCRVSFAGL